MESCWKTHISMRWWQDQEIASDVTSHHTVSHQMVCNFLFWKLYNHILSDAALSWHHMIYASFFIEKNVKYQKNTSTFSPKFALPTVMVSGNHVTNIFLMPRQFWIK